MRFYLIEILAIITVCAFGLGTLLRADPLDECLFFSFTLCVLLAAVLCAVARRGEARYFWIGFAIAGCSYLYYAHLPDDEGLVPRHNGPLVTTQLLRLGYNLIHSGDYDTSFSPPGFLFSVPVETLPKEDGDDVRRGDDDDASMDPNPFGPPANSDPSGTAGTNLSLVIGGGQRLIASGESIAFMRIGHSMWALLLGWMAGHFTQFVRRKAA